MREVNEAWRVLGDRERRTAYDRELIGTATRGGRPAASTPARNGVDGSGADLVEVAPPMGAVTAGLYRHGPWVALVLVFGVILVLTAYAGSSSDDSPAPGVRSPAIGSCVDVATGPITSVVSCDGPYELRIVQRVDETTPCPAGTERRRLGTDGLLDCVVDQ